jgi:hypothetical protein
MNTKPMSYKGQLKGFPTEVVEKMLEEQERQTGKRDVSVFEGCLAADDTEGGFAWRECKSGDEHSFWRDVIRHRNFDRFFEKYPKQQQPMEQPNKYPMLMWVGDDQREISNRINKRVVFMEKCGKFLAWDAETFEEAEKTIETFPWDLAIPCVTLQLTRAEIAAKFGVDEVEIVD